MTESCIRWSNSSSGMKETANTTGTKLGWRLSRLVLLSLGRPGTQQVWLLGEPMLRLVMLSPLRHQRAARQQPRLLAVLLSLQKSR